MTLVADLMTRKPIVVRPEQSIEAAISLFSQHRVSAFPVTDSDDRLVGIISAGDLMWRETGVNPPLYVMLLDSVIYLENPQRLQRELHKSLGTTVADVMTAKPVTIEADRPIREAAKLMQDRHLRRLPVLAADGTLVGIITQTDIVRSLAARLNATAA